MEYIVPILIGLIFLVLASLPVILIGGLIYLVVRAQKKGNARTQQIQAMAAQMQWTYAAQMAHTSVPYADKFRLFTEFDRHRIDNLILGVANGNQVLAFDYRHGTKWGRNTRKFQTVVLLISNKMNLPAFYLRPATFGEQLGSAFTHSVGFPSHVPFTDQYLLGGGDDNGIRHFFTDPVLNYCASNPGLSIEAGGGQMFVYREHVMMPPEQIGEMVQTAMQMAMLMERAPR